MKIVKIILTLIIILNFNSCNSSGQNNRVHAEYTTYSEYSGKIVKSINYYNDSSPYTMVIIFTDGSILNIYANKYVLDVEKLIN